MALKKHSASLSTTSIKRKRQRAAKAAAGYSSTTLNIKNKYKEYLWQLAEVNKITPSKALEVIIKNYKINNPLLSKARRIEMALTEALNKNK